ncbi:MAG TPA: pyridoxal 5'-phosphate synthase glutaminase subunit PdxT [Armatimonadaceae bacterium]|nr:pyridoxal 5'-phosphate synthase glutaminase subunit PdxT [Armatimonadaceae bacterium]
MSPVIGVLALQGDFQAHARAIEAAGGTATEVRTPEQVAAVDGLILPGGESTTIGKLMARYGIDSAIRDASAAGMPIYGTCAGMILLAREIAHGAERGGQPTLGLMDIAVARNAFGRQVDSFEADIHAPGVTSGGAVRGVFIRAPYVERVGEDVEVLGRYQDRIVLVRQGNLLASAFHPELTGDTRLHRYFLDMVSGANAAENG